MVQYIQTIKSSSLPGLAKEIKCLNLKVVSCTPTPFQSHHLLSLSAESTVYIRGSSRMIIIQGYTFYATF